MSDSQDGFSSMDDLKKGISEGKYGQERFPSTKPMLCHIYTEYVWTGKYVFLTEEHGFEKGSYLCTQVKEVNREQEIRDLGIGVSEAICFCVFVPQLKDFKVLRLNPWNVSDFYDKLQAWGPDMYVHISDKNRIVFTQNTAKTQSVVPIEPKPRVEFEEMLKKDVFKTLPAIQENFSVGESFGSDVPF